MYTYLMYVKVAILSRFLKQKASFCSNYNNNNKEKHKVVVFFREELQVIWEK